MNIILLEEVAHLGGIGDLVRVKDGYARNYLVPQGKAKVATKENVAEIQALQEALAAKRRETKAQAELVREKIEGAALVFVVNAGETGKLYGSVGGQDIADKLLEVTGVTVDRKHVMLPDGNLRMLGDASVTVKLHTDVQAVITVTLATDTPPAEDDAAVVDEAATPDVDDNAY